MSDWAMQHAERVARQERAERHRLEARVAKARAARDGTPSKPIAARLSEFACHLEAAIKIFALAALGECEQGRPFDEVLTLEVTGEIGSETELKLCAQIYGNPQARRIVLRIDSGGGAVAVAENIFVALRAHPAREKTAIVAHACGSAALLLAAACTRRIAGSRAQFLVHKTWAATPLDADARAQLAAHDLIEEKIVQAAGVDLARFKTLREGACTLSTGEAVDIGLIQFVDDAAIEAAQSDFSAGREEASGGGVFDDAMDAEIPDHFELQTIGGETIRFPVNREAARAVSAMMRPGDRGGTSAIFGLPSAYRKIAEGLFLK